MRYMYSPKNALLCKLEREVRQTLHHIMGMLELVSEQPLRPSQAEYLGACRAGADRLLQIANDVTELAAPDPFSSPNSIFDPCAIANETAGLMAPLAGRKGLEFHLSLDPSVPKSVSSEPDTIQDMLRRILDNSIKFTMRGSVTLSVHSEPLEDPGSALLRFEVRDTGPGIPKEILDELRTPPESPRAGLGFAIIQKRLAALSGELFAQSSASEGTTVRISLPVNLEPATPKPVETGDNPAAHQIRVPAALKLLVAEDSDDSFNVFQMYVEGQGHSISRALTGAEAVEMVKSNEYDIIIMDIDMPEMDGFTATRIIREWETGQGKTRVPIIVLSAERASHQRRLGASVGCSGYLTKPVPKLEVLQALNYFSARSDIC